MKQRVLGRTGFSVSEVSLGAWQMGGVKYGMVSGQAADPILSEYLDRGGNFIDTAHAYDESEVRIGHFLRNHAVRDRVIVASKTHQLEEPEIRRDLEHSLSAMGRDCIDLYYLHAPPAEPDQMVRTLDVFERLKAEGKIGAIGASIKGPNVISETAELSRKYIDKGKVDVLMLIYSILRQDNERSIALAGAANVGVVFKDTVFARSYRGERTRRA